MMERNLPTDQENVSGVAKKIASASLFVYFQ